MSKPLKAEPFDFNVRPGTIFYRGDEPDIPASAALAVQVSGGVKPYSFKLYDAKNGNTHFGLVPDSGVVYGAALDEGAWYSGMAVVTDAAGNMATAPVTITVTKPEPTAEARSEAGAETLTTENRGGRVYVLEPGAKPMSSEKKLDVARYSTFPGDAGDMVAVERRVGPDEWEELGRARNNDGWFRLVHREPIRLRVLKPGGKTVRVQLENGWSLKGVE